MQPCSTLPPRFDFAPAGCAVRRLQCLTSSKFDHQPSLWKIAPRSIGAMEQRYSTNGTLNTEVRIEYRFESYIWRLHICFTCKKSASENYFCRFVIFFHAPSIFRPKFFTFSRVYPLKFSRVGLLRFWRWKIEFLTKVPNMEFKFLFFMNCQWVRSVFIKYFLGFFDGHSLFSWAFFFILFVIGKPDCSVYNLTINYLIDSEAQSRF